MAEADTRPPAKAKPKVWDQQPGENILWYVRFLRFVALGPTRSVSLVAVGRRNAYPVPAHWPIVAKQNNWRERASVFDEQAKTKPGLIEEFNQLLASLKQPPTRAEEIAHLEGLTYVLPVVDEEE